MSKRVKSQEFLDTDSDDSDDSTQHTKVYNQIIATRFCF